MATRATKTGITKLAKQIPSNKPVQKAEKRLLDNIYPCKMMGNSAIKAGTTEYAKLITSKHSQTTNTIDWSPLDPKFSCQIRKCLANGYNAKIRLAPESWKNDLPQLCELLGLKYRASTDDVLSILNSSSAFSVKAIIAGGFVPIDLKGRKTSGTKEVLEVEDDPENGSVKVKIRIPMQYDDELAGGKDSPRREEFELFVKNELVHVFKIPISLLSPEVHIAEIQNGSMLVTLILSTSALTLINVGKELPQTITWQEKKFEILMGMGGAAAGSLFGVVAGGPVGAAIGAVTGTTAGLTTAWFVDRDVDDGAARAQALLKFTESANEIIIEFFNRKLQDQKCVEDTQNRLE